MAAVGAGNKSFRSGRVECFTESVIRDMTRQAPTHRGVNLAQGFPDFPAPEEVKEAGRKPSQKYQSICHHLGCAQFPAGRSPEKAGLVRDFVNPETEITVCCGATEGMMAALMAVCDPGEEVIMFEPLYENYGPDTALSGAKPKFVKLRPPQSEGGEWTFDEGELRAAFDDRTKAIIVNTPNNPTGNIITRAELEIIRDLCVKFDVMAITDEIYEHIVYNGAQHVSMAALDGMQERTVTINSMSKTYSVTGWRVGWTIAPPAIADSIRKVHDFLTVGAPAPLQQAGAMALALPRSYYDRLAEEYTRRATVCCRYCRRRGSGAFVARRLLHHDRHSRVRLSERRGIYPTPGAGCGRGGGAGIEFLSRSAGGRAAGALCLLQEGCDAGCGDGEAAARGMNAGSSVMSF